MAWLKWMVAALLVLCLVVLGVAWSIGYFATEPVRSTDRGAIDGYDPVAYFTLGAATPGDPALTTEWRGAVWRFASATHRELFLADPVRYAPAYGGYCAYAMGNAYTARADPQQYSVVDGRLFLNFDAATRARWQAEQNQLIAAGDRHWPESRPGRTAEVRR